MDETGFNNLPGVYSFAIGFRLDILLDSDGPSPAMQPRNEALVNLCAGCVKGLCRGVKNL